MDIIHSAPYPQFKGIETFHMLSLSRRIDCCETGAKAFMALSTIRPLKGGLKEFNQRIKIVEH